MIPDEILARRAAELARAEEWKKQRELEDKLIRAGSRGLIKQLGLTKALPVDVATRKRIANAAKRLRGKQ